MSPNLPETMTVQCRCCPARILAPREVRKVLRNYKDAASLPLDVEVNAFGFCSTFCQDDYDAIEKWKALRRNDPVVK